jgi:SAM-dependent methyltransferase
MWSCREESQESSAYSDEMWGSIDALVDDSWWYRTRNRIILQAISQSGHPCAAWDLGCGSGVVAKFLIEHGVSTLGVEPSRQGAVLSSRRGVTSFHASIGELRLPDDSLDLVTMFDVLEHIEKRDATLAEVFRVLKPGGRLVLTVPALSMLWSHLDGGHFVRYSRTSLRKELERAGFVVKTTGYFFFLTVLPLIVLRVLPFRLGMRRAVATEAALRASGGVLGRIAAWSETRLAMRVPFGSSVLAVAETPVNR